jgi:hypothetical protein
VCNLLHVRFDVVYVYMHVCLFVCTCVCVGRANVKHLHAYMSYSDICWHACVCGCMHVWMYALTLECVPGPSAALVQPPAEIGSASDDSCLRCMFMHACVCVYVCTHIPAPES